MRILKQIKEPTEKNVIWAKANSSGTYDEFIWGVKGWEPLGGSGGGGGGPETDPIYLSQKPTLATKADVDAKIAAILVNEMTEEQVEAIVEEAIQTAQISGQIATETWVNSQLATIPVVHDPEVFTVADPVVATFGLDKVPLFISEVLVLNGDTALYYLQATDYSIEGRNITIINPTLTSGWRVKVLYTYMYGS